MIRRNARMLKTAVITPAPNESRNISFEMGARRAAMPQSFEHAVRDQRSTSGPRTVRRDAETSGATCPGRGDQRSSKS